ncbi:MAG: ABC transporter permease [Clostridia bacterium]|nr:ABC transporter permease [Clostridia bacterium]
MAIINALIIVTVYMGVMFTKNMDDLYTAIFDNSGDVVYVNMQNNYSSKFIKQHDIKQIKTVDYVCGELQTNSLVCHFYDFATVDKALSLSEDVSSYADTASVILHIDNKGDYNIGDDYNINNSYYKDAPPINLKVVGFYSSEKVNRAYADFGYINENYGITDVTVYFKMEGFSARRVINDAKQVEKILKSEFKQGRLTRSYLTDTFYEMNATSAIFEAVALCIGAICFIVSAFSIANSLIIICEEASPLLGLLKACGSTKRQLFGILLIEIALIVLIAVALSCLLTLALSTVAVAGVDKFLNLLAARYLLEYGSVFTISHAFPFWLPAVTFVAFTVVSVLISRVKIIKLLNVTPKQSLEGGDR